MVKRPLGLVTSFALVALGSFILAACQPPGPVFKPCDIREGACQKHVFQGVEAVRGRLWDPWSAPPTVVVIGEAEHRQQAALRASRLRRAAANSLFTVPLQEAGLVVPQLDVVGGDEQWFVSVVATYSPSEKRVTFVDRGFLDNVHADAVLVHEFVHAFQDRELNTDMLAPLSTDQEMVRRALTEGEAVVYETVSKLMMQGLEVAAFSWTDLFVPWLATLRSQTAFAPSAFSHIRLSFAYPVGGAFLAQSYLRHGTTGVNRRLTRPPRSFLELLAAVEDRALPPDWSPIPCQATAQVAGTQVVAVDTLGSALFYAHLLATFGDEEAAWESAYTWRGDMMWIVQDAALNHASFWRIHAPGIDRTALGPALAARTVPPILEGSDVLFWTGVTPPQLAGMKAQFLCSSGLSFE